MFVMLSTLIIANAAIALIGIKPILGNIMELVAGKNGRFLIEVNLKLIQTKFYRFIGFYGSVNKVLATQGNLRKDITREIKLTQPKIGCFKTQAEYLYNSLDIPSESIIEVQGRSLLGEEYCFILNINSEMYLPLSSNYSPHSKKVINATVNFDNKKYDVTKICRKWSNCGFHLESVVEYVTRDFLKENDDIVLASIQAGPSDLFQFKVLYSDLDQDTLIFYK